MGWNEHSERKAHEISFTGEDLPQLYRKSAQQWSSIDKDFAVGLFDKTTALVEHVLDSEKRGKGPTACPRLLDFDARINERREVLQRTSDILSVVLGVTLVIVGTPPPAPARNAAQNNP